VRSFLAILGLIFVVLKLTGIISAWSWFWVLSPFIAIVLIWLLVFGGIAWFITKFS
jgi:hypothetical protein